MAHALALGLAAGAGVIDSGSDSFAIEEGQQDGQTLSFRQDFHDGKHSTAWIAR